MLFNSSFPTTHSPWSFSKVSILFHLLLIKVEVWKSLVLTSPDLCQLIRDFCSQIISSYKRISFLSSLRFVSSFNSTSVVCLPKARCTPSSLHRLRFFFRKIFPNVSLFHASSFVKNSLSVMVKFPSHFHSLSIYLKKSLCIILAALNLKGMFPRGVLLSACSCNGKWSECEWIRCLTLADMNFCACLQQVHRSCVVLVCFGVNRDIIPTGSARQSLKVLPTFLFEFRSDIFLFKLILKVLKWL